MQTQTISNEELMERVRLWTREMNELPLSQFMVLEKAQPELWKNITGILCGDTVEVDFPLPKTDMDGITIDEDTVKHHGSNFTGRVDGTDIKKCEFIVTVKNQSGMADADDYKVRIPFEKAALIEREEYPYPSRDTLYVMKDRSHDEWLIRNVQKISALGFIVYDNAEEGVYLGFDTGADLDSECFKPLFLLMFPDEYGELAQTLY